jgi:hypothetical protein
MIVAVIGQLSRIQEYKRIRAAKLVKLRKESDDAPMLRFTRADAYPPQRRSAAILCGLAGHLFDGLE